MTEYVLPPSLRVSGAQWGVRGSAAAFSSPFNGATRTYGRGGDLWAAELSVDNASNQTSFAERAYYAGLLAAIKSRANRVWMSPPGYVKQGNFPATEALVNADLRSVTGWSIADMHSPAVSQNGRLTGYSNYSAGVQNTEYYQGSVAVTLYAPYVLRSLVSAPTWPAGNYIGPALDAGWQQSNYLTTRGLIDAVHPAAANTSANAYAMVALGTSVPPRTRIDLLYASMSRCFLVDNAPNLLTYSEQIDNAAWTRSGISGVTANNAVAPDGTTTGEDVIENGGTGSHYVQQSISGLPSAAQDYSFSVYLKAGTRTHAFVQMEETTGGTTCFQYVNLSTGALDSSSTSANWSNLRVHVTDVGNSWFRFSITARKTNAATGVIARVGLANAANSGSYTGDGASYIRMWGASLAASSQPVRYTLTTTTASSGTSQATSSLYVKGLPASTNGLLLPGDFVQIGNQLEQVIAPLDSDAAGLGYLQLSRPQRTAPADNAAVIVEKPMGRFLFAENDIGYSLRPGQLSDYTIPLIEDVA